MNTNTQSPKRTAQEKNESVFCLCMLLFIIFEVFLLTAILISTFSPPVSADPSGDETESESEESTEAIDPAEQMVFSGGVLPIKPTAGASTATISGIESKYAVLVKVKTGEVIASLGADTCFDPASMTKVMTLIVACENLKVSDLDVKLTMTEELFDYVRTGGYQGGGNYGIDVGDSFVLRDLLYGVGVKSSADCAMLVVDYICGNEEAFVELMNQKASELGLTQTHFDNIAGNQSPETYSTSTELATVMAYAMQCDLIRDILGCEVYKGTASGYNSKGDYVDFPFTFYSTLFGSVESRISEYEQAYQTTFRLQSSKLLAGKTGYVDRIVDGERIKNFCLVSYVKGNSNGDTYVLVLGGAAEMKYTMKDVKAILDTYVQ